MIALERKPVLCFVCRYEMLRKPNRVETSDRRHIIPILLGFATGVAGSALTLTYFEGGRDAIQATIVRRLDAIESTGTAAQQRIAQQTEDNSKRIGSLETGAKDGLLADKTFQTTIDATRDRLKIIFDLHERHSVEEARLGAQLGEAKGRIDVLQSFVVRGHGD